MVDTQQESKMEWAPQSGTWEECVEPLAVLSELTETPDLKEDYDVEQS